MSSFALRRPDFVLLCLLLATSTGTVDAAESYVEVLDTLSAEGREAALVALRHFESENVDLERPRPSLSRLAAAEVGLLREVADRDGARALLPIVDLHAESYLRYMESEARFLLPHSRLLAEKAIDLYLGASQDHGAPMIASRWLTVLAGNVLVGRSRGLAAGLLERALTLDPGNAPAALGLAAIHEKEGRYEEVVRILDRHRGRPIDQSVTAEIRLRLGINLRRCGETLAAGRELQEVARSLGSPGWIRTLAYQELARTLFDLRQWSAAQQLLDEAVELLPGDERLLLMSAYAHERQGRPRAAAEMAALVEPQVGGTEDTRLRPRDRYNRYPRLSLSRDEGSGSTRVPLGESPGLVLDRADAGGR